MVEGWTDACQAGGVSLFTSGIDPGFANDLLRPRALTGFCVSCRSIRIMEILTTPRTTQPEVLFGRWASASRSTTNADAAAGLAPYAWGGVIAMMADGLGVESTRSARRTRGGPPTTTFDTGIGVIEAGTMAGLRFEVHGIVDGEPKLVVEHVTRMNQATSRPSGRRATVRATTASRCRAHRRSTSTSSSSARTATTTPEGCSPPRCES